MKAHLLSNIDVFKMTPYNSTSLVDEYVIDGTSDNGELVRVSVIKENAVKIRNQLSYFLGDKKPDNKTTYQITDSLSGVRNGDFINFEFGTATIKISKYVLLGLIEDFVVDDDED